MAFRFKGCMDEFSRLEGEVRSRIQGLDNVLSGGFSRGLATGHAELPEGAQLDQLPG